MQSTIESLDEVVTSHGNAPVWQKWPAETDINTYEIYEKYKSQAEHDVTMKNTWKTTNGEYGRFSMVKYKGLSNINGTSNFPSNPEDIAKSLEALGGGSKPGSRQRKSALASRSLDSFTTELEKLNHNRSPSQHSGFKLPPIDRKYLAATRGKDIPTFWGNRTVSPDAPNAGRYSLTTGYAKRFMVNECNRLWNNMDSIVEEGSKIQVLKVDRPNSNASQSSHSVGSSRSSSGSSKQPERNR